MDKSKAVDILSGRRKGPGAALLRSALLAASGPYAAIMRLRRLAYRCGCLPSKPADAPVICVGNITTGGTGKTPMVAWVAQFLVSIGARPAVLTRGYMATGGKSDEAELLGRILGAGVPVIVNADRQAGAAEAIQSGANVLVMDDGFQHRRLRRDLDIVLIDATNPFGYGHCLPRGLLREPPGSLADAGAIVITRSDQVPPAALESLRLRLAGLAPHASLHMASHRPAAIIDQRGQSTQPAALTGRRVMAFCGLANPEGFFATARALGAVMAGEVAMEDHARYTQQIVDDITHQAQAAGAEVLLTTQKDFVKLVTLHVDMPVWQLAVAMELTHGAKELTDKIAMGVREFFGNS